MAERTCPKCGVTDTSNRHVFSDGRALHRECCQCELCIEELKGQNDG